MVLFVLGVLAVLSPGVVGQAMAGAPLSAVGLLGLGGVVYAAVALPRLGWVTARWLALGLAIVVAIKLLALSTAPPIGLMTSYWAKAAPDGPPERSTDFPWLANATRIEPSLDVRGDDFAVHFFNDAARFNFGSDVQPGRDQLPFSVRWQGWLLAPSDGERRFVLAANGASGVWLDDAVVPGSDASLYVSAGLHTLRVEYARPEARVPLARLSWQRLPGGALESVGGTDVRWQPSAADAAMSPVLGRLADAGFAALLLAWIVLGLRNAWRARERVRACLGLVPLVFLVHGMLLHAPLAGRATILSGLDDWLIYESSARDILLNGPLMDGGQGHAPPFYGQPLYPYVLALAHRLTGESLFGPLALQYAALGGVLVGSAVLARRAFGTRLDGLVALAFAWVLVQLEAEHLKVARQLFNENLYMPLVLASLIAVVGFARQPKPPAWWQVLLAGGLLGLTAIARSQFLLFVPFGVLILMVAWRHHGWTSLKALGVVAGVVLVIAPVTARNWLVSGQLVAISSSGGASLLEFHRPPPGLIDQAALDKDPLYEALHLDPQTRTVVAFARADPGGYLATLWPLGAHSIGLQGRNDPGIYWPLLATSLLYLLSFGLKATRRLHVWPIHAFVATHLLVLMLFEADTYGYRLVVPMYAPMAVVAAQLPLAAVGFLLGATRRMVGANRRAERATRFAALGWSLLAVGALLWQAKSLIDIWPDRETSLHGLGGPAAVAAQTADRVGAETIYVASIDGTPRRFGAGSLPGLRYPWFKWFDPSRSVPLPKPATTAIYMLSELNGQPVAGDLVSCLGAPDANAVVVIAGDRAQQQCAGALMANAPTPVIFDAVARIDALRIPESVEAGQALETRLVWQPLVARPEAQQVSLQLDDPTAGDGTLWGNGTLDLYPARQWEPGEALLSRLPVATDPTAIPQPYRVTLGIGPTRPNAPPATALWQGARTTRVPVSTVALTPGNTPLGLAPTLPADMRPLEGPPLSGGGLELIGLRPLPAEAAIGGPLRVGLLWRAMRDGPDAAQFKMRLVRANGEVVQETVLPLLGGRLLPSALHAGSVVRDEQSLVVGGSVPSEVLSLDMDLLDARGTSLVDASVRLGSLQMTGRAHVVDASAGATVEATFGEAMQLLSDQLEPAQAKTGEKVTVKLRWQSAAAMTQAYKVFVHVLDPAGAQVVAQRDAEPQDGKAPTPGWVVGEVVDDEYAIALPGDVAPGDYPVEIGVYDPRSGDRLKLANGDNRLVLATRLKVR